VSKVWWMATHYTVCRHLAGIFLAVFGMDKFALTVDSFECCLYCLCHVALAHHF